MMHRGFPYLWSDHTSSPADDYDRVVIPNDAVEKPSHYAKGEIECIDAIQSSMSKEAFEGYLKGVIQKYIWRYESKGKPIEDLKKANEYLRRLIISIDT